MLNTSKKHIIELSAIFSGQQISTEMGPKIFFLQMVLDDVLSNNMKCDEIFRSSNLFGSLKIPNIWNFSAKSKIARNGLSFW